MNFLRVSILSCLFWFAGLALAADVPEVGSLAPNFTLPDQSGTAHTLIQYRGKWLVLYFYPKDDTPGCTEQALSLIHI